MIESLKELSDDCIKEMKKNTEIKMTVEDEKKHRYAKKCYLCGDAFNSKLTAKCKVRDHDHRTGCFRGSACASCNINYFSNRYLPIVFHNLRGYDSHFIIKKAYESQAKNVNAIPNSNEKFMTFSFDQLKFIDSFQFMATSLDNLVENLKEKDGDKFLILIILSHFMKNILVYCVVKAFILMNGLTMKVNLIMKGCLLKNAFTVN